MLALRRSALRILSSSPSAFVCKPRTITSLSSQALLRSKPASQSVYLQRRWATTEPEAKTDEGAPVSEPQPTPEEEVENAIHTDSEAAAVDAAGDAAATPFQDENVISRADRIAQPKPTIYVGNLFFDITDDDLTRELARFGAVKRVRLMRDSRGLSKGFAYVDFEATEAATAAIESLHQQLFEGRRLVVQYAAYTTEEMRTIKGGSMRDTPKNKNPPSKTLFIGNMSFEMTDRDLNNLFRGIRNVVDVRVAIDRRTGQPRGFAHADFIDVKSAMEAMKILAEKETYGRKLRVDYSFGNSQAPKNQTPPPTEES